MGTGSSQLVIKKRERSLQPVCSGLGVIQPWDGQNSSAKLPGKMTIAEASLKSWERNSENGNIVQEKIEH